MNKFSQYCLLAVVFLFALISCSDDNSNTIIDNDDDTVIIIVDTTVVNLPPRQFDATAAESGFNSIVFRWTESTDPENSIVKYNVFIAENTPDAEFILIGENLSEQQVADTNTINVDGTDMEINPPENPDFRFAYIATNLIHNKQYKGKVVAIDQDGYSTESLFWSTTLNDDIPPQPYDFNLSRLYRYNARFGIRVRDNYPNQVSWKIFLNNELHNESTITLNTSSQGDAYGDIVSDIEGLAEETLYNARIIVTDLNGNESEPYEFSFVTTNDTFYGDLIWGGAGAPAISESILFDANEYRFIVGNIRLGEYNLPDISFESIEGITGNVEFIEENSGDFPRRAFPNVINLNGDLSFQAINPIRYFENLETINGSLNLSYFSGFRFEGNNEFPLLDNLTSVTNDVSFFQSWEIQEINGFNSLTTVNGNFSFVGFSVENLNFLSNLTEVINLSIGFNSNLTDFCGLETLVNANGINGIYHVYDNIFNPSLNDLLNGDCSL